MSVSEEDTPALVEVSLLPRPKPVYKGKTVMEHESTEDVS